MSTFLITGMGRSGSTFLARVLDAAPGWRVNHEPAGSRDAAALTEDIQRRFDCQATRSHYGEVNSHLRYVARDLKVDLLGVLVRRPDQVWVSIANRKPETEWLDHLADYERAVEEMAFLIEERGAFPIRFDSMTQNGHYLAHVRGYFTGHYSGVPESLREPVNATARARYYFLVEFDSEIRKRVNAMRLRLFEALTRAA